ncbi:hypothetical protein NDU88_005971 [Pleurodeles waltl]|uniref:Uncharacterized protein n=1 Tax=Pleurodeles waltl TaxID=8319 RepID=A0AAV7RMJ7_PLEWA|nr:hypothetical protein NDU88_005971 [Pleurodeles waltl]
MADRGSKSAGSLRTVGIIPLVHFYFQWRREAAAVSLVVDGRCLYVLGVSDFKSGGSEVMAKANEALLWKKRLSIVYAGGIWVVVSCISYKYIKDHWWTKKEIPVTDHEELHEFSEPKPPIKSEQLRPFFEQKVVYKENFIPYTTRIYNYVNSVFGNRPEK